MAIYVNQKQTAELVGCSRNNFCKQRTRESSNPGTYSYFNADGKMNIADPNFIAKYGDHVAEWQKKLNEKNKIGKKSILKTPRQIEQEELQAEIEKQKSIQDPAIIQLREKATQAKLTKQILEAQKADIELKKSRSELVEREKLGEICFKYLSDLNQRIIECPSSFIDEFEAEVLNKATRSQLTDILRRPICDIILEVTNQIDKELKSAEK